MKTLVINLSHRKDRLDKFKQNNADFISYDVLKAVDGYKVEYADLRKMGFDTDHDWIDPILEYTINQRRDRLLFIPLESVETMYQVE